MSTLCESVDFNDLQRWRNDEKENTCIRMRIKWNAQNKSESKRTMLMQSNCDGFVTLALAALINENKKFEIMDEKMELEIAVRIQIHSMLCAASVPQDHCAVTSINPSRLYGCHLKVHAERANYKGCGNMEP